MIKDKKWKKRFIRTQIIGMWLMIPIYIFLSAIPNYYTWAAEIPPIEELQVSEGQLLYKRVVKHGYKIGLKTPKGVKFFTCRTTASGGHSCWTRKYRRSDPLESKSTKVWWFEQSLYPFTVQNTVVQLAVEGEVKLSWEEVRQRGLRAKERSKRSAFILLVLCVLIVFFTKSQIRKIENG